MKTPLTLIKILLIPTLILISFSTFAQEVRIIKLPELEQMLKPENDTTYVINFWATWCKPCVKEMPFFERLNEELKGEKAKVILVSLDFKRQIETQLKPFLVKNNIRSLAVVIDEPDYNSWIDKVDPSWSGAIPATIIINAGKQARIFHEKEFKYEELYSIVKPLINQ